MPEPIAYVYRQARDSRGKINADALGSLIPKDRVEETMEGDRILYIHQPPSSETQPGVLILMDGEQEMRPGDSVKSTPAILDELCKKKQISPQVTVYIPAPEDRIGEYACNKEFADFLSNKLVPLLQEPPFGCSKGREQTTIGGTSFGGLAATHAALTHPETFGNVLSQSGAFWWNKDWKGFDKFEEWGNSLAVRIPAAIARRAHFSQGTAVEVALQEVGVTLKAVGDNKLTLDERLALFDPQKHGGEVMVSDRKGKEQF